MGSIFIPIFVLTKTNKIYIIMKKAIQLIIMLIIWIGILYLSAWLNS